MIKKYDKTLGSYFDKYHLPIIELKIHQRQKCEDIVKKIRKCFDDLNQLIMKLHGKDVNK